MITCFPSDVTLMWVMFGASSDVAEIFLFLLAGSISVAPPIYSDRLASTNLENLSPLKTNFQHRWSTFTKLTKASPIFSFGHDETTAPPSNRSEYSRDP